jgi:probable rRNA maturation factor
VNNQKKGNNLMTINFEYEATEQLNFDYELLLKKVVEECLDYEECPYESEVSILFTNDLDIQQINQEFRGIDAATDVLSFPSIEYETAGDFSMLEASIVDCFHPETGELLLGDIVISVDRAKLQAKEFDHTLEREIAFLTAHSMFHLMGYDHMEEDERILMEAKQKDILNKLQILR